MNYTKKSPQVGQLTVPVLHGPDALIVDGTQREHGQAGMASLPAPVVVVASADWPSGIEVHRHVIDRLASRSSTQRGMPSDSNTEASDRTISASKVWARLQLHRDDMALDDDIDANAQEFAMSALMFRLDACMKSSPGDLIAASHLLDALSELKRILGSRTATHVGLNQAYSDLLAQLGR